MEEGIPKNPHPKGVDFWMEVSRSRLRPTSLSRPNHPHIEEVGMAHCAMYRAALETDGAGLAEISVAEDMLRLFYASQRAGGIGQIAPLSNAVFLHSSIAPFRAGQHEGADESSLVSRVDGRCITHRDLDDDFCPKKLALQPPLSYDPT